MSRLFFATDIHGSERCFRKFINAGRFYKADVLILGGDLTGKAIIPIVHQPDGTYVSHFIGTKYVLKNPKELNDFEDRVRGAGYYPCVLTPEESERIASDKSVLGTLFKRLIIETLERWIALCKEHLRGTNVKVFVTGGNDDEPMVEDLLKKTEDDNIVYCEGKVVWVDDSHEMISTGYSNLTPFECPRDVPEEVLAKKIEEVVSKVENMENCIFNMHCPPYGSGLDLAPELDKNLKPVIIGGKYNFIPCGSTAVMNAIKHYQPLLGLHGHIHESPGAVKIGRTLCINPGSEYTEGILKGTVVNLDKKGIKGYILTSG
ncbi:MAG: metallophosphoesterase [Candidatus Bathyarchaeia archaeon]|nr:metallophosphoesterase [Candidatus Bathyarchaeota archaeon]